MVATFGFLPIERDDPFNKGRGAYRSRCPSPNRRLFWTLQALAKQKVLAERV